ncbi:MAG: hypothetical protein KJ729_03675 [Euryarchaeota archaeon]|nr:hypothetical protein [Euryarchaeota archaeon]
MHRHVCPQAYVDAPSRGATLGVHLRINICKVPVVVMGYSEPAVFYYWRW